MESRRKRILPKMPLESSVTSLEASREEQGSAVGTPREEGSTTADSRETTSECKVIITHPTQMTFTCPECGVSYHVYSSLQRHMRDRHKDRKVTWVYICSECGEEFQDKKKVSAHVNRVHVGKVIKRHQEWCLPVRLL